MNTAPLQRTMQALQTLAVNDAHRALAMPAARALLREHTCVGQIELRGNGSAVEQTLESPVAPGLFATLARTDLQIEAQLACAAARRAGASMFSRSYFVPMAGGRGQEMIDICIPLLDLRREAGFLVASERLPALLENTLSQEHARRHEFSIVEADGTRVARTGHARGAGVYKAERVVDLAGMPLLLPGHDLRSPLVDSQRRHTGWMSAVLDLSAQRALRPGRRNAGRAPGQPRRGIPGPSKTVQKQKAPAAAHANGGMYQPATRGEKAVN